VSVLVKAMIPVKAMPDPNQTTDAGAEDARWVLEARSGDHDAFDRLVERYQRRAVSVSYRLLGNIHDASDVAQDAFLRAFQNLAKLEDARRFGPWLMRIVTNLSLNFRRARSRSSAMSTEDMIEGTEVLRTASGASLLSVDAVDGSPDAEALREAVVKGIDALPEKQRLALVLFSIEGLPQKEVAEIMGCTIQLVKWNVFQARKTLRKVLAAHLDE
jgi:RNA polymerase sigma-70 factor (ECF subfamily)